MFETVYLPSTANQRLEETILAQSQSTIGLQRGKLRLRINDAATIKTALDLVRAGNFDLEHRWRCVAMHGEPSGLRNYASEHHGVNREIFREIHWGKTCSIYENVIKLVGHEGPTTK